MTCRVLGTRVFLNGQKNGHCRPFAQVTLEPIPKKNLKEVRDVCMYVCMYLCGIGIFMCEVRMYVCIYMYVRIVYIFDMLNMYVCSVNVYLANCLYVV